MDKETYSFDFKESENAFFQELNKTTYWKNNQNPFRKYLFRGKSVENGFDIQVNKFGIEMPRPRLKGHVLLNRLYVTVSWKPIVRNHTIAFCFLWLLIAPIHICAAYYDI